LAFAQSLHCGHDALDRAGAVVWPGTIITGTTSQLSLRSPVLVSM